MVACDPGLPATPLVSPSSGALCSLPSPSRIVNNRAVAMTKFSADDAEEEDGPSTGSGTEVDHVPEKKRKRSHNDADEKRNPGRVISVTVDPDLLDFPICMEPLLPPIYQCWNGHIACSSCCSKIQNKCHSCSQFIGTRRCLAMEKVVESIQTQCCYASYGCMKSMLYAEKTKHEESCIYAPYICPILNCTFSGPCEQLSFHLISVHSVSVRCFRYNNPVTLTMDITEKFLLLHGADGLLLLVDNATYPLGNAVMVSLISPTHPKSDFAYDLTVRSGERSLRMQSFTKRIKQVLHVPSDDFLLVPPDVYLCDGQIKLEICVYGVSDDS